MEPTTFILFGATGDLAKRKIYPALYNLFVDQKLSLSFGVIGLGRRELTDDSFRASVEHSIRSFSRREADNSALINDFLRIFRYSVLDIDRKEDYKKLLRLKLNSGKGSFAFRRIACFIYQSVPNFLKGSLPTFRKAGSIPQRLEASRDREAIWP